MSIGTRAGAIARPNARAASTDVTIAVVSRRQRSSRSPAISTDITTIQPRFMAPSANSAAINPQQHPRHDTPCRHPDAEGRVVTALSIR